MATATEAVSSGLDHLPPSWRGVPCGRPTKSGTPCGNRRYGAQQACKRHETPEDLRVMALIREAWEYGQEAGFQHGREEGRRLTLAEAKAAEQALQDARDREAELRRFAERGVMTVEVERHYCYLWRGSEPLEVGDAIWLPGSEFRPERWQSRVVRIGRNSYTGPLSSVLSRVEAEVLTEPRNGPATREEPVIA